MAATASPEPVTVTERMTVAWPIVLTVIGATWYLGTTLSSIESQLRSLVTLTASHDGRLREIERLASDRGPRLQALEEEIRRR